MSHSCDSTKFHRRREQLKLSEYVLTKNAIFVKIVREKNIIERKNCMNILFFPFSVSPLSLSLLLHISLPPSDHPSPPLSPTHQSKNKNSLKVWLVELESAVFCACGVDASIIGPAQFGGIPASISAILLNIEDLSVSLTSSATLYSSEWRLLSCCRTPEYVRKV